MVKLLVNTKGRSNKFWQVRVKRMTVTVSFGRIGRKARTKVSTFKHGDELCAYVLRKVDEKRRRGYTPVRVKR